MAISCILYPISYWFQIYLDGDSTVDNNIDKRDLASYDIISVTAVILSSGLLMFLLKKKYQDDYKKQRWAVSLFVCSELSSNIFYLFYHYALTYSQDRDLWTTVLNIVARSGTRTLFQAFGFLFLKKSRDPLEGI